MAARHFTIIGGGIAGLAAGLALARMREAASIFEQATKFEPLGAGIQLGPNAVRALEALDAWDAVSSSTYAPPAIHIWDASSGDLLKEIDLGASFAKRFGRPYRVAHRADLHTGLLDALKTRRAVDINLGQAISHHDRKDEVIAADGINSPTRLSLFPDSAAKPLPLKIFRALVPMPQVQRIEIECVNLWLFPQGHIVHYPVSAGSRLNIVAVTPAQSPHSFFSTAAEELRMLLAVVPEWSDWPGAYVPSLPSWGRGNVRLIGDAAHGTLPFLAQGAAMALEDAVALATAKADPAEYEAARRERTTRLHRETLDTGNIYHFGGAQAVARNFAMRAMPQGMFLQRLAWIYQK